MISLEEIDKKKRKANLIFKVPENYFENMRLSITKEIEMQENMFSNTKEASFSMPEGYFESLSSKILDKIDKLEDNKITLESLDKANVFKVPDGYFEQSELNIGIERFGKENIYQIPNGYFEQLNERILSNISTNNSGKIIEVNWFNQSKRNILRWSAAAIVVLMLGWWYSVSQPNDINKLDEQTALALEKVSKDDIKTYLETQDLSYLEYQATPEMSQSPNQKALDGLKIDKQDILDHLEIQSLEEEI
jgi:hypothetical protein